MRFFSSCSRTTASWRERVQTANQWASADTRGREASGSGFKGRSGFSLPRLDALDPDIVRLLQIGVLPVDDRLGPELLQIFLEFAAALLVEDSLADLLARLVERKR